VIDFIKIILSDVDLDRLVNSPHLELINTRKLKHGGYRYTYKSENLEFTITGLNVRLSGSLHIYCNLINTGQRSNSNDYTINDIINTIQALESKFGIIPSQAKIERLEYGVNVRLPFIAEEFVQSSIIAWDGKENSIDKDFDRTGKYKKWQTTKYGIKAYDKGKKDNEPYLFRFEINALSEYLKKFDITHLSNLTDRNKLEPLGADLTSAFDKLIIVDDLMPKNLSNQDEELFNRGINPNVWRTFPHRMAKSRFKKKFNNLLQTKNQNRKKKL